MISVQDCIDLCGLNEDEVAAIGEHEHIPEVAAAALAQLLVTSTAWRGNYSNNDHRRYSHSALSRACYTCGGAIHGVAPFPGTATQCTGWVGDRVAPRTLMAAGQTIDRQFCQRPMRGAGPWSGRAIALASTSPMIGNMLGKFCADQVGGHDNRDRNGEVARYRNEPESGPNRRDGQN